MRTHSLNRLTERRGDYVLAPSPESSALQTAAVNLHTAATALGIELLPWQRQWGARILAGERFVFIHGQRHGLRTMTRAVREAQTPTTTESREPELTMELETRTTSDVPLISIRSIRFGDKYEEYRNGTVGFALLEFVEATQAHVETTLGYIDRTLDNGDGGTHHWRNDEVMLMLSNVRAMLDPIQAKGSGA